MKIKTKIFHFVDNSVQEKYREWLNACIGDGYEIESIVGLGNDRILVTMIHPKAPSHTVVSTCKYRNS